MDFKQIECFVEVIKKKSFSNAAEVLYMSQPAVTSNVQKLEAELGILLIDRTGKGARPTDAGKIMFRYGQELLNLRLKAFSDLKSHSSYALSKLEIFASSIPEEYIVPKLLKEFMLEKKDALWHLHSGDTKNVIDNLATGRGNLGFTGAMPSVSTIDSQLVFEDEPVMVAAPNKNFAETVSIEDLQGQNLIVREDGSGTRKALEENLKKLGYSLNSFAALTVCESGGTIKKMVEMGMGISFLSNLAIKEELAYGKLSAHRIKGFEDRRSFYFVWAKDRHLSPVEESFKRFVLNSQAKKA